MDWWKPETLQVDNTESSTGSIAFVLSQSGSVLHPGAAAADSASIVDLRAVGIRLVPWPRREAGGHPGRSFSPAFAGVLASGRESHLALPAKHIEPWH